MAFQRRQTRTMPGKSGLPSEESTPSIKYDVVSPNQYSKFYYFYGCSLHQVTTKEFRGDCPFPSCENPKDHFYVNGGTGQFDCKRCGESGNIYSFMQKLHAAWNRRMTPSDYEWIAAERPGISVEMLRKYNICRMGPTTVMLPNYNLDKQVSTVPLWRFMYMERTRETLRLVANPPIVKILPFGLQFYSPSAANVDLVEGQWDCLAHASQLAKITDKNKVRILDKYSIIGSPGSQSYPRESLNLLDNKNVRILFDNDTAGTEGINKILRDVSNSGCVPLSVKVIEWPSGTKVGTDLRDLARS